MRRGNKLANSNVLLIGAIPTLLLGAAIIFSPDVAHLFSQAKKMDPRMLGGGLMGLSGLEIAYAIFLRFQI